MPETLDHIAFLSQEIGPRPAGTEEEQQAALYITEQMQKEAGLSAVIEDFNSASNADLPTALCAAATIIATIAGIIFPIVAIPALIVAALAAALVVLEVLERPVLSKMMTRGISQNVVAKYEPAYSAEQGGTRRRKIVLVANYDSGKVRAETGGALLGMLPLLQWGSLGAIVFVPVFLLIRDLFFLHPDDTTAIVLNVITGIALVLVALPLIFAILHKFSAYNEGANCNASGVAVLLETAQRIGRGRVNVADLGASGELTIHGEEAARASGLVPEGAQIVYEAAQVLPPELAQETEEDRLAAAKDAIAALTGKPVSHTPRETSIASNLVQVKDGLVGEPSEDEIKDRRDETREAFATIPPETLQEAREHAVAEGQGAEGEAGPAGQAMQAAGEETPGQAGFAEPAAAPGAAGYDYAPSAEPAVPDWFKKAQEKAKKPKDDAGKVQRSRYADALDAAMVESSAHFSQANRVVNNETEERLRQMREGIMEVSAPQFARVAPEAEAGGQQQAAQQMQAAQPAQQAQQTQTPPTAADMGSTVSMPPINVEELRGAAAGAAQHPGSQPQAPAGRGDAASAAGAEGQGPHIPPVSPGDFATAPVPDMQGAALSAIPAIDEETKNGRAPISLPEIGVAASGLAPLAEMQKQRAPLAVAEENSTSAAKSLLNMLPTISADEDQPEASPGSETAGTAASGGASSRPDLRSMLPSLSGSIKGHDASAPGSTGSLSAGAFVPAGATGTFAPVGDELLDDVAPEDIFVDDADDSDYTESMTETGAFAGSGYVEMPKSRARRFFDRFRKDKDKEEDVSAQQWLDVEEDFDARSAGAARGGWESFQDEDGFEDGFEDQEGGTSSEGTVETRGAQGFDDGESGPGEDDYSSGKRSWRGGAFSRTSVDFHGEEDPEEPSGYGEYGQDDLSRSGELQQIYEFRNPDISTEVWFVALGSELANNGGMKAFLAEHESDLRGSIIINIAALGNGQLSLVRKEGRFKHFAASNRIARYIQKASRATGIDVGAADLLWENTPAAVALRRGFQAFSVMGVEKGKPAGFAQGNDVLENIDDAILEQNADFIMELLKNI